MIDHRAGWRDQIRQLVALLKTDPEAGMRSARGWIGVEEETMDRTSRTIEERLRAFLDRGYRPRVTPHLLSARVLEEGYSDKGEDWATILIPDGLDPDGPMRLHAHGWRVDAMSVRGGQALVGGVFPTVDEALAYTEGELDKYDPPVEKVGAPHPDVAPMVETARRMRDEERATRQMTHFVGDDCSGGHRDEQIEGGAR